MTKGTIALTGSSGFIGTHLIKRLEEQGYKIWPIRHHKSNLDNLDLEKLAGCHALINLAGENLLKHLWTKKFKRILFDSRVKTTEFLARSIAGLAPGPKIFLSASAIGFYGDGGQEELNEQSPKGEGFLADLCHQWEIACEPARLCGVRVVNLRTGVVLGAGGGMFNSVEPVYRMGLGGPLGSGRQYMAPIALDDEIAAIIFALENPQITGPLNLVCPAPITNADFSRCLGQALKRPVYLRLPASLLKLFGEQAGLVLNSTRVIPQKLLEAGFRFSHTNTQEILKSIIHDAK